MVRKSTLFLCIQAVLIVGLLAPAQGELPAGRFSVQRLHDHVLALSAIQPARNYENPASLDRAAAYIFKEFSKCSSRVTYQPYRAKGHEYRNVIASFAVDKRERIVIGAHYDVCGDQPGADDNASGVSVLLELARVLARCESRLKKRVDLAAYTLEEPPLFRQSGMGSALHARTLAEAGVKVRLMVSVDMIGSFLEVPDSKIPESKIFQHECKDRTNATALVGKTDQADVVRKAASLMAAGSSVEIVAIIEPPETEGVDFSDHLNFWKHDYPAFMVSNFFVNPGTHYHTPQDTIDKLDFRKMAEIGQALYRLIIAF